MNNQHPLLRPIRIFIVEDDPIFAETAQMYLEKTFSSSFDLHLFSLGSACVNNLHLDPDLVITDLNLPDQSGLEVLKKLKSVNPELKSIVLSGQQDVQTAVDVHKIGVEYYILKGALCWDELKNAIEKMSKQINLQIEIEALRDEVIDRNRYSCILGSSPAILKVFKLLHKVERNDMTVLITGESGTGKELIAKTLHYNSSRKKKSFVPVNVPAIPDDLIETELFGHEKGAFTGAVKRRIGKFEEAHQGSIFLDEIGEMNPDLQAKLLRVLQEKEIVRVGNNKIISTDVRVIASTNRDLLLEVKNGRFREDLFYRINGFQINLPPLRERGDDVILLARHFLREFCRINNMPDIRLSKEAVQSMLGYTWPGNVRELKSAIERAALITDTQTISPEDINLTENKSSSKALRRSA